MSLEELYNILLTEKPSKEIKVKEVELFELIPELEACKGFDQYSTWHDYDVYHHTLHVIDGVESDLTLRLAALFHDIGKPRCFTLDEAGEGHFYGHYAQSMTIFNIFAFKHNIDPEFADNISNLIYYHDLNLAKLDDNKFEEIKNTFTSDDIIKLYKLKLSDLMAHSKEYHYLYPIIEDEEEKVLKRINKKN